MLCITEAKLQFIIDRLRSVAEGRIIYGAALFDLGQSAQLDRIFSLGNKGSCIQAKPARQGNPGFRIGAKPEITTLARHG